MSEDLEPRLNEYVTGLTQLQEQEQARLADLERRTRTARQNVGRIKRAIKELTGEVKPKGRPPKLKKPGEWNVSEAKKEQIRKAIEAAGEAGITSKEIIELEGVSAETVRKAIAALREDEVVRKAGMSKGNVTVYKLMPKDFIDSYGDVLVTSNGA